MKTFFVLMLGLALVELGSALKCYTCNPSEPCDKTQDCTTEDACLSLSAGDVKLKRCISYQLCDFNALKNTFPYSNFKFSCCTSNLCNAASVSSHSVMALLFSLAVFWWCVL